jgi:3-isopropylmalate/(R)-2-methylmalate dehydratase small subunit
MRKLKQLSSRAIPLPIENVDTDQIIPARFLTTTTRTGLGPHLFADWRFDGDGQKRPGFVLNQGDLTGVEILIAGQNFGCGSSREHAVWALHDYGFQAVVSSSFADIFRANALRNGLLAVEVPAATQQQLLEEIEQDPQLVLTIDLESQQLLRGDQAPVSFDIDPFARHCIIEGLDELGYLLEQASMIERYEAVHPPRVSTLGGAA